MNYYERHLGDYVRDCSHLSMLEDGAYSRLMDAYYIREAPLPADVKECCKLARATTTAEKKAVAYVLAGFFERREDGHHQKRCDEELDRYRSKSRKASASANARWEHMRNGSERNANGDATGMRTHSEGICESHALQTPVTSNQSPDTHTPDSSVATATPCVRPDWLPSETEMAGVKPGKANARS